MSRILTLSAPAARTPRRGFLGAVAGALGLGALATFSRDAAAAPQGSQPYIGEIMLWAGNFAPLGWAFCDGATLPIAQYEALFNLIGTTYGGDGQTTFRLPDLRGRVPLHEGTGPGLSPYVLGQSGGSENVSLVATQIPAHDHAPAAASAVGATAAPANGVPGRDPAGTLAWTNSPGAAVQPMSGSHISTTGGSQPHTNLRPILALNFVIALEGIFPSMS